MKKTIENVHSGDQITNATGHHWDRVHGVTDASAQGSVTVTTDSGAHEFPAGTVIDIV